MNILSRLTTVLLLSGGMLNGAYATHAVDHHEQNDAVAIDTAKVSMKDARQTALGKIPGKPTPTSSFSIFIWGCQSPR